MIQTFIIKLHYWQSALLFADMALAMKAGNYHAGQ